MHAYAPRGGFASADVYLGSWAELKFMVAGKRLIFHQ